MATLLLNPACARGDAYPAELRALLSVEGARRAHASVSAWPGYAATPLVPLPQLAARLGVASLLVKDEGRRFSVGSFKALGGALAVLRAVEGARPAAVACATDGNHGRAVAWGAQRAGVAAFVFVHSTVSEARADAIASFGATVVREGATYDDAVRACAAAAARHGWCLISDTAAASPDGATAFDAATVCVTQGYSVVALEIDEAGERPTHVFVQAGVGGLAAGLLSYRWERFGTHRPVMTVVEPERAACCFASALAGALVSVGGPLDTLCAGLACGEPSALAWRVLARGCDAFMTITDDAAEAAMREFAGAGVVAGESGAAGLAGLLLLSTAQRASLGVDASSRVIVYNTERDTDAELYERIVGAELAGRARREAEARAGEKM